MRRKLKLYNNGILRLSDGNGLAVTLTMYTYIRVYAENIELMNCRRTFDAESGKFHHLGSHGNGEDVPADGVD